MNEIWEFFFCPVHGILRPQVWQFLPAVAAGATLVVRRIVTRCKK